MATIIAFFDTTLKEKESFERYFSGNKFQVLFFEKTIAETPIYEYKDAEVISMYSTSYIDSTNFANLPKLKLIACRSTSFDNIDLKVAKKNNITICNVPAYGQTTVAEYTIMLMLMLARRMPAVLDSVQKGTIEHRKLTGFTLHGKTLGVIGTGEVGRAVISIAKAIGMHVIAYNPSPDEQASKDQGYSYVKLPELLAGADIVTLHAPLTQENQHIISTNQFKKMKEKAYLINTARGELVDTTALIEALHSKKIAGAALDVAEGEQSLRKGAELNLLRARNKMPFEVAELNMLSRMNNVILSPHNAFNSKEALYLARKITADNIIKFLANQPQNVVNP